MSSQNLLCSVFVPVVLPCAYENHEKINTFIKSLAEKYLPNDLKVLYYEEYNLVITIQDDIINFYSIYLPNNTVVQNIYNNILYPSYTVYGSYLILFINFYLQTYIFKTSKSNSKTNKQKIQ